MPEIIIGIVSSNGRAAWGPIIVVKFKGTDSFSGNDFNWTVRNINSSMRGNFLGLPNGL